jgi:hypothetical protein
MQFMNTNQFMRFWVRQVKKNQNLRELCALIKWLQVLNIVMPKTGK